jgi:SAM-dependent methyltransferase
MPWSDLLSGLPGLSGRTRARDEAVPDRARALQDLSVRLRRLGTLFEIDRIRSEQVDVTAVADYYAACHDAYRKYHSSEGAVHMALNEDGRFDASGFTGQLRRLEAGWGAQAPRDVLEIGFGQGFNLGWLAKRHPGTRFVGVDLTAAHVALARERIAREGLANVELLEADLHHLPLPDASVDEVFAIEAFCHAIDLPRALAEVARVLRPGGRFVLTVPNPDAPEFAVARRTPTWFHQAVKGPAQGTERAYPTFYAYGSVDGLVARGRAAGLEPEDLRQTSFVLGYLARWPALVPLARAWDGSVNRLALHRLQGHVCLTLRKPGLPATP